MEEYIKSVVEAGIDAFIVSDPFIISHIKKNYPIGRLQQLLVPSLG